MSDRLRVLWARCLSWMFRRSRDSDFGEELQTHLDFAIADQITRGHSPLDARRRALARLGGMDATRQLHRDWQGWPALESFARDLRSAARLLRRSPTFTAVAVLSLALGIGANSAIFSILNGLVLRPLPVREPSRLVQLLTGPGQTEWSYPLWEEVQSRGGQFAGVAAWGSTNLAAVQLIQGDRLDPLDVYWASGGFFDVLGIRAARGRFLTGSDDRRGGPAEGAVAVVSDDFWRRRLGLGAPGDIIGKILMLNRFPVTIVGVAPPGFFGPEVGASFDLVLPLNLLPRPLLEARGFSWLSVVARLKPGQTRADAAERLRAAQTDMRAATLPAGLRPNQLQEYFASPIEVAPFATGASKLRSRYQQPLVLIMGAVVLVLLIACANIAHLLLARADARRHELAVRLALGASRGQLVRQLLMESALLSGLGALTGMAIVVWGGRQLVTQLSTSVTLPLPLDWHVLGFTGAVALTTALLFGIGPALHATRMRPTSALAASPRSVSGPSRSGLGRSLVVAQIALSLTLTAGAGLLLRTFGTLAVLNLGFDPDRVLAVTLTTRPGVTLGDEPAATGRLLHVLEAVRAAPSVQAAAFSGTTPMSGYRHDTQIDNPPGLSLAPGERDVFLLDAGPGWFETLGMHILKGRDFNRDDVPMFQQVAVVNETLARRFFPDRSPIGATLQEPAGPGQPIRRMTIVGVVNDAVYTSARDGVPPTLYHLLPRTTALVVRSTSSDPEPLTRVITQAILQADPAFLVTTHPLSTQARATVARERLVATLSSFFGVLALLLSGIGVYGVMAHGVGQRRTEIAVRRALGAADAGIVRLVLTRSLTLVGVGVAIGVGSSLWTLRFLQPLLFGLEPDDPATFFGASLLLGCIGFLAAWIPARRAVQDEPASILRLGST